FFFSSRRRHTRFSRDWSSDVCSSDLTKPFALAIRLFANMTAGHFVILSLLGLIFVFEAVKLLIIPWLGPVAMATAIMLLEVFVAFLQAYIFAMLTSVFIGLIRHAH